MATNYPTNYSPVNVNPLTPTIDQSKYFNNYFKSEITVNSDANGTIISFFEKFTGNKIAAQALASAVIYTAASRGLNPMDVLLEFKNLPTSKLNSYLTMFLNSERVGTSYLGITNAPVANKYVYRAILP
jgi:hypothetical protein